ncbi:MAG TPA: hypothetical protein VMZ11_01925 [Mycobacteriales bacterium]|nr:hypothetical protein [Mycobacteriales bacterium]
MVTPGAWDSRPPEASGLAATEETSPLAGKNKGGREARKPKQDHNKKTTGQTPSQVSKAFAPGDSSASRPAR